MCHVVVSILVRRRPLCPPRQTNAGLPRDPSLGVHFAGQSMLASVQSYGTSWQDGGGVAGEKQYWSGSRIGRLWEGTQVVVAGGPGPPDIGWTVGRRDKVESIYLGLLRMTPCLHDACRLPLSHGCGRGVDPMWFDVGPPSQTVAQHQTHIGSISRVLWIILRCRFYVGSSSYNGGSAMSERWAIVLYFMAGQLYPHTAH